MKLFVLIGILFASSFAAYDFVHAAEKETVEITIAKDQPLVFRRVQPSGYKIDYPDFFVLETEVTNAQFKMFLLANKKTKDDTDVLEIVKKRKGSGTFSTGDTSYSVEDETAIWRKNDYPKGLDDHPVALITLKDANDFAEWLSSTNKNVGLFRLPTWNEWMIAAYGKDRAYPWGKEWDTKKLHSSFGFVYADDDEIKRGVAKPRPIRTEPVKSRPKGRTPEGIFGMLGNVSEYIVEDDVTEKSYFNLGARWMGNGFTDGFEFFSYKVKTLPPRKDYWGYSHGSDLRECDLGFRLVLDPRKNKELIKRPQIFKQNDESWMIESDKKETQVKDKK
jgi:formylglycine-generating enzyme required for sulfatase activity